MIACCTSRVLSKVKYFLGGLPEDDAGLAFEVHQQPRGVERPRVLSVPEPKRPSGPVGFLYD